MATKKLQMLGYKIVPPEHVGKSAYEIAVDKGFEGTEEEWLTSLKADVTAEDLGAVKEEDLAGKVETIINDDYNQNGPVSEVINNSARDLADTVSKENIDVAIINNKLVSVSEDGKLVHSDPDTGDIKQVNYGYVGAAPSGYGVAEKVSRSMEWNIHGRNGFYKSAANSPDGINLWYGISCVSAVGEVTNIAFNPSDDASSLALRHIKGGEPAEWEYVNPPMLEGVEYRTTERINGSAVYKTLNSDGVLQYRIDGEDIPHDYLDLIGAAPAGYGLGTTATKITDWNDATKIGFYWNESQTDENPVANAPFPWQAAWGYTIAAINDDAITQVAFTYTGDDIDPPIDGHYQKVRYYKKGLGETPIGWSEWEYVNPQMMPSVEYRTTERWNGKPVYARMLNCGALPNATNKHVFIANNISNIVRLEGYLENTAGYTLQVPITATNAVELALYNHSELRLTTTSDQSTWNAYISVYYTKDS